jgi:hypothetical protein
VASYNGSLRIPNTQDAVDAVFEIGAETVRVTTGSEVLGSWAIADVVVEDRGDTLLVTLGGEAVLVEVPDRSGFSSALTPSPGRRSRAKKRRRPSGRPAAKTGPPTRSSRRQTKPQPSADPEPIEEFDAPAEKAAEHPSLAERIRVIASVFQVDSWRDWLQDTTVRWTIASMGVVLFAVLALFATSTLGMILVLGGMVSLIVAALAVSEDINAYRLIPSAISETGLVAGGAIAMVIGGLLVVLG